MLRQIQSLPDSSATEAIFSLSGYIPIEAQLHIRALGLFCSIFRLEGSHTLECGSFVTVFEGQASASRLKCPLVLKYLFLGRRVIWTTLNF